MIPQLIFGIIIIVIGMYVFGVGTDFLDDIVSTVDRQLAKQNEVPSVSLQKSGNFAKETNTRVCDLNITFYGTMNDYDYYSIDLVNILEQRFIYHGDESFLGGDFQPFYPAGDRRVFDYQWYCTGPAITQEQEESAGRGGCTTAINPLPPFERIEVCGLTALDLLSWNLNKNTKGGIDELSLLALGFSKTAKERIQVNFVGKSLTNSDKYLFTPANSKGTDENPFTKSIDLPSGADFPYDYRISITLSDVTEDNYLIEFWDKDYVQNSEPVGHIFSKKLCKPGLNSC